ncbi:MAG: hypothetical protein GY856_26875 [bacterium]|nr:hypothetical protein [bacterium]
MFPPLFFREAGPLSLVIVLLAVVAAVLAIINIIRLARADGPPHPRVRSSVDAILFWGGFAAAAGLFQHWSGLIRMTEVISRAHAVSPMAVAEGFRQSLLAPAFGLLVFMVGALVWFALRSWIRRLEWKAER